MSKKTPEVTLSSLNKRKEKGEMGGKKQWGQRGGDWTSFIISKEE